MLRTLIALAGALALLAPVSASADAVHEALEDYALYQNDVSALLDADIDNNAVDAALARVRRHSPANIARGWIAYGALTAAQSPAFARSFNARGGDRTAMLSQLRGNVGYAREQTGASQAVQLVLNTASADGARAGRAGDRYDQFARSGAPVIVLASSEMADMRGGTRLSPEMRERLQGGGVRRVNERTSFGGRGFWDSLAGRAGNSPGGRGGREARDYASVTDHMLTLAALVAAGAADRERSRVRDLLDEPLTQQCMLMQQLQLRQCLSVTVDASERAYCLGTHGLTGFGGCFSNVVR